MYGGSGEVSGWAELLSAAVGPPGTEQVRGSRTALGTILLEPHSATACSEQVSTPTGLRRTL